MMKGDKMARRSSFGSIMRKKLSDITNSHPQQKSLPALLEKPSSDDVSSSTKDYIENLTKENLTLVKLIQDKNKLIELSGIELQKLRINLQKLQLQNWNLAQSNSQMLAELNFGKEKLKSLHHELSCKEALLKAKAMELKEGKVIIPADSKVNNEDGKPNASNNRQQRFTRSRSMGSAMSQQVVVPGKETTTESKRRCLRRQSCSSSRIPQQEQQETSSENLFEIDDMKLSPLDPETSSDVHMDIDAAAGPITTITSPANTRSTTTRKDEKHDDYDSDVSGTNSKRSVRTSIGGRPLRKAAEKVQSYKEIPLKTKMRREV